MNASPASRALAVSAILLLVPCFPVDAAPSDLPEDEAQQGIHPGAASALEAEAIRRTNELYDAAFLGRRTDEAARDIEVRIAALLAGKLSQTAPDVVELYGGLAGMYFSANRIADGGAVVRRLFEFCRRSRNDTLLVAGLRKMLAVPALRSFARRTQEIQVLENLLKDFEKEGKWSQPEQLDERLYVALLDCLGTAHMLDRNGDLALRYYQEARTRASAIRENLRVEDPFLREAFTVSCRIFPLSGLVSTYLIMGEMERALAVSDELVQVADALADGRLLPAGHPARMTLEGALQMLGEAYTARQEEAARQTGAKLPMTLKERRNWKLYQEREQRRIEELAKERDRRGLTRRSPFTAISREPSDPNARVSSVRETEVTSASEE